MFGDQRAHQRIDQLTHRVNALEALVRRLASDAGVNASDLAAFGTNADPGLTPEVRRLVADKSLIPAIKKYREATGVGLAEAKRAVESYRDRMRGY